MKKYQITQILFVLLLLLVTSSCSDTGAVKLNVMNLKCEYQFNPIGVDSREPILSWQIESTLDSVQQHSYQILVSSSLKLLEENNGDLWNTGKINDNNSIHIQYSGRKLESNKTYYWKVRITDNRNQQSEWSDNAMWEMGLLEAQDWKAKWITFNDSLISSMPIFYKDFVVKGNIKNARVFLSGLGYSELYLNGKKVGNNVLDPAQTNYDEYAFYTSHDIKSYLNENINRIGVMLGDGWYNQKEAFGGVDFSYGKPLLICQLQLEYENGETETIYSNSNWKYFEGPIVSANVYAGELYDARKEIKEWSFAKTKITNTFNAEIAKLYPPALRSQMLPPIKKMKELEPKKYFKNEEGNYIYDLGQNFAGWVKIKVNEPRGTNIQIRMSEELYPNGTLDFTSTGVRATKFIQIDKYICKSEGIEEWEPRFTYHGFRYVELSGLTNEPKLETVKGIVVYSSVSQVGTFKCSNPQINKLHELALWTLISNIYGFPTDCPHREKCGWLGDAHSIAPFSIYNYDMESFWIKYLNDIRSSAAREGVTLHHQAKNRVFYQAYKKAGIPFMIAPGKRECGAASPDWGTALVQIPWYLYLYYGNESILKEFYPDMKLWANYLDSLSVDNIITQGLGDWCPPGGNVGIDCPFELSSTAFFFLDLSLVEQSAIKLGFIDDAKYFRNKKNEIKHSFIKKFYDAENKTFGSQTANSIALDYGLYPDGDAKEISNSIKNDVVNNYSGFHHTGIFGLARIFDALAKNGNEDIAFNILTGKGKLSFENMWKDYQVTTLWETLPVEKKNKDIYLNDTRGSHNHPMQGGFDAWFYKGIAGISPLPEKPGFKTIRFEPMLTEQLDWAEGEYESKYGLVKSSWKWKDKNFLWEIIIPPNSNGEVYLPFNNYDNLKINDNKMDSNKLVKVEFQNKYQIKLSSGKYKIELKMK